MSNLKFLVIADIHGKSVEDNLEKFIEKKYDLLIVLGDITQFGPPSRAGEIIDKLKKFDIQILSIPGNCDPEETVGILKEKGVNLHLKSIEIEGFTFAGLGGSNFTPFDTPFEFSEREIGEKLNNLILNEAENLVLVTHAPPYETKTDLTSNGTHAGSKSIKRFIEEKQPIVNLCAHIHEARGIDNIGKTKVVNPGPIGEGFLAEIALDKRIKINLLRI